MRGAKRINTLDFCSYMRADQFFMRAKTSIMRADTFEVSFATWQNCIFGGMLPKLMANASNTAVVKATFAIIPPWDVPNSSSLQTFLKAQEYAPP
jgi:hypothetical protein